MNKQRILSAWAARLSLLLCDCVVIAIGIMQLWGILIGALSPFGLLFAVPCLVSGIAAGAMHSKGPPNVKPA